MRDCPAQWTALTAAERQRFEVRWPCSAAPSSAHMSASRTMRDSCLPAQVYGSRLFTTPCGYQCGRFAAPYSRLCLGCAAQSRRGEQERVVAERLVARFGGEVIVLDRTIPGAYSYAVAEGFERPMRFLIRPDIRFTRGRRFTLVVEVDERSHTLYRVEDEVSRVLMMRLLIDGPLFLLRYTPEGGDLEALCDALAAVLDSEAQEARVSPGQLFIRYLGYPPWRLAELDAEAIAQSGAAFPGDPR